MPDITHDQLRAVCDVLGFVAEDTARIVITPREVTVTRHLRKDGRMYLGDDGEVASETTTIRVGPEPWPETLRSWGDLRSSGLLWLINRVVFHPRGWALALVHRDDEIVGWKLLGDGREPWRFDGGTEGDMFAAAESTLAPEPADEPATIDAAGSAGSGAVVGVGGASEAAQGAQG